jgi:hypothetical protein
MKKILFFLFFNILFSSNLLAETKKYKNSFTSFNKWLSVNGYNQYIEKSENEKCKSFDKGDTNWYYNNCDQANYKNNLNIKTHPNKWGIHYPSNPNRDSLIYYFYKYQFSHLTGDPNTYQWGQIEIKPSNNPYEFKFKIQEDKFVKKQIKTKGILSYLYFQDENVLIDEISPKERLGEFVNNETKLMSMSMNKSVTSYIMGHAICEGYIDGIDSKINDWPLIENTLYYDQKLINLLNMAAGDQKYINEFKYNPNSILANLSYEYETNTIMNTINRYFKNTTQAKKNPYNYSGFITQLLLNYIKHKTGDNFEDLLKHIFQNKVKNKYSVNFNELKYTLDKYGNGHPMVRMTRFDYLRLAKAIMDDYQNDTCVGKYLKEIHKRRIPKKYNENKNEPEFNRTKSYGGQFHMDYPGLKNKVVFGMGGYGGQAILIDVENSRIVVLNSLHFNNGKYKYNVKKLLIDPIKKGR